MINVTFRARRLSVWILVLETYTNKTYKKNFSKSCKKPPTKCKLLFALYIVNKKKKIFQIVIFLTFSFGFRLHLLRRFQKGITLGVLSHISYFGRVVGVARGRLPSTRPQVLYVFGIVSPNAI